MRMVLGGYGLIVFYYFVYFTILEVQSKEALLLFLLIDLGIIALVVRSALFQRTVFGAIILYMGSTAFSLIVFAHYYMATGVWAGTIVDTTFKTGFYFSVITWTSLGYGDVSPTVESRVWVMIEVFYGYLHMGVLLVLIQDFLKPKK